MLLYLGTEVFEPSRMDFQSTILPLELSPHKINWFWPTHQVSDSPDDVLPSIDFVYTISSKASYRRYTNLLSSWNGFEPSISRLQGGCFRPTKLQKHKIYGACRIRTCESSVNSRLLQASELKPQICKRLLILERSLAVLL